MMNFVEYLEYIIEEKLKTLGRSPGFIAAKRAVQKGEPIGVLTARANKEGHSDLLNRLQKSLGKEINSSDIHFINDPGYVGADSAEKKLNVIKKYANEYASVKFYDDEEKNLKVVKSFNLPNVKVYDIKQFDPSKLKPLNNTSQNKNVIHLFDLDGTVWKLPAYIRILDYSGKEVSKITQEQFAEGKYKLKKGETLSFKDFVDPKVLKKHAKSRGIFSK